MLPSASDPIWNFFEAEQSQDRFGDGVQAEGGLKLS